MIKYRAFMCLVDFESERGQPVNGNRFFSNMADLRKAHDCVDDCGIAEIEISLVKVRNMNKDAWKEYSGDFDSMSDDEIEKESDISRDVISDHEHWLEAVASWEAAGKPRGVEND